MRFFINAYSTSALKPYGSANSSQRSALEEERFGECVLDRAKKRGGRVGLVCFFSNNHSSISSLKSIRHLGWVGEVVDVTPRIRIPNPNHARGLCDDDDDTDECRRPTKNTSWTTTRVVLYARRGGVGGGVAEGCDVRGWVRGAVRDGWVFFIVFGNHG